MSATSDKSDGDRLAETEAHLERLAERVREKMLREGEDLLEERTKRAGREVLERLLQADRRRARRRRTLGVLLAAAAAALLVTWLVFFQHPEPQTRADTPLGKRVTLVYPPNEVRNFDRFEWKAELPPGGEFQL